MSDMDPGSMFFISYDLCITSGKYRFRDISCVNKFFFYDLMVSLASPDQVLAGMVQDYYCAQCLL